MSPLISEKTVSSLVIIKLPFIVITRSLSFKADRVLKSNCFA